jgi:tetratricopeptide (TPR) repeat protein
MNRSMKKRATQSSIRLFKRSSVLCLFASMIMGCSNDSTAPGDNPDPGRPEAIASGWIEFEAGRFGNALGHFNEAIVENPLVGESHWGRGWCLVRLAQYVDAAASFGLAVDLESNAADAQAGRALAAATTGAHDDALAAANTLLALAPNYVFIHDPEIDARDIRLLRAQLHLRRGAYAEAAADLDVLNPPAAPHSTEPGELLQALAAQGGAVQP